MNCFLRGLRASLQTRELSVWHLVVFIVHVIYILHECRATLVYSVVS